MFMACLMPAEPSRAFHSTLLQSISLQRRQRLEELLVVFFSAKIHSKVQGNQVRILLKNLGFLTGFVCLTIRPITPFYTCIYSNYITRFRIIWNTNSFSAILVLRLSLHEAVQEVLLVFMEPSFLKRFVVDVVYIRPTQCSLLQLFFGCLGTAGDCKLHVSDQPAGSEPIVTPIL